jgi:hypothetical protein
MDVMDRLFQPVQTGGFRLDEMFLLSLLVAFIVGQLNAWFYQWTHRGVSYSRTFTQSLVLISMVSALSMTLVTGTVVAAFGLLGGLAIIRFRTIIRDARDLSYVFLSLICGMAAGFGFFGAAVVGAITANLVSLYLHATGFGAWYSQDSLLRFEVAVSRADGPALDGLLARYCRRHAVLSVDEPDVVPPDAEPTYQYAYKVRLRDPEQGPDLVSALKTSFGVHAIHLLVDQEHEDVA